MRAACWRLVAVATTVVLAGCTPGSDAQRDASASGSSGSAATGGAGVAMPASNRVMFVDGDERSELGFTRHAPDSLGVIEEARFGDDGKATRRYTFDDAGALLRMHEEKSQTVFSGNQSPAPMRSTLTVIIRSGVPVATKTVDGTPGTVQAFEVENVKRRAELIFRLAPR